MHKILLIIQREYTTRVKKRSFIVMSLLGPLLFATFFAVPILLATMKGDAKVVEVIDESGLFDGKFSNEDNIEFRYLSTSVEEAKAQVPGKEDYGLLYIPRLDIHNPEGITLYSDGNLSIEVVSDIRKTLKSEIRNIKLREANIEQETLDKLQTSVAISTINLTDEGEKESSSGLATAVGYGGAFLVYMFIFMYGVQVMRGVIEEKNNRIVEVIVSSVKPFQLMAGKIIGVAGVGLTQFLIWVVLTLVIFQGAIFFFGVDEFQAMQEQQAQLSANSVQVGPAAMSQQVQASAGAEKISNIVNALQDLGIAKLVFSFIFFFLGGYLLYAALFAAIGSAVDQDADTQQFMLPVTMPLILSMIGLTAVLREPHGAIATWMSMIPFTSPVIMMMRLPFGVPIWELVLSMGLLILGFIFTTWLAGRIYRIGILMHGAKVNYKTLAKWFFMR